MNLIHQTNPNLINLILAIYATDNLKVSIYNSTTNKIINQVMKCQKN